MIRLMIYRATPPPEGEGSGHLLNTTDWQRYASQQLRREIQCIRNADTLSHLASFALHRRFTAATGATSTSASTNGRQPARRPQAETFGRPRTL